MHLALTLPSWDRKDQGTGAAGATGKLPGPNSDTKGQIIQRRRQQILYAPVAYLIQEEGYDEMFIITGCFIDWLVTILVLIYHICIHIYSLLRMFRTYNFIYFMGFYIIYTQNT